MPYVRVWIHLNWTTKHRRETTTRRLKPLLPDHIVNNAKEKEIYVGTLNCVEDHIHILISPGANHKISKVAQLIRSESSRWVNLNKLTEEKFEWQDDYFAISASDSAVSIVRDYIWRREEHHHVKSYDDECREMAGPHSPDINVGGMALDRKS